MSSLHKKLKLIWLFTALVSLTPRAIHAQIPAACDPNLKSVEDAATEAAKERAIKTLLLLGRNQRCYAEVIARSGLNPRREDFKSKLSFFEANRTDKQEGSSVGSGGTNLVSKGITAQVLSFAAEQGALTESVNKNVVTLQGTLEGIPAVLIQKGLVPYCFDAVKEPGCLHPTLVDFLRRFSYSVSFNTGDSSQTVTAMPSGSQSGTAQPVVFQANRRQISQVMGKFTFLHVKESASPQTFLKEWQNATTKLDDGKVGEKMDALWGNLIKPKQNLAFANWLQCTQSELKNAASTNIRTIWLADAVRLVKILDGTNVITPPTGVAGLSPCTDFSASDDRVKDIVEDSISNPTIQDQAAEALHALTVFAFNERDFVATLVEKPVLTFEFDYNRPTSQPDTMTFKLIYGRGWGSDWAATGNASLTIFNSQPSSSIPGAGRVASWQVAAQVDRNFNLLGPKTASGAYYFQSQVSPGIINVTPGNPAPGVTIIGLPPTASQVFAEKGNIHVGQFRISIGAGQSNVKFPISLTISNRTELIAKPEWRGQFGINYDLDALFSKK